MRVRIRINRPKSYVLDFKEQDRRNSIFHQAQVLGFKFDDYLRIKRYDNRSKEEFDEFWQLQLKLYGLR
jgi:hypothetical protein